MTILDRSTIREEISLLGRENMELKRALRATWTKPMADEQRRRVTLRARITELLVLLAAARGRLHVTRPPRGHAGAWDARAHADAVVARLAARSGASASPAIAEARS